MTTTPATAPTPASANFEKLKAKLRELFELDKADLDFGIYRVLRARHGEIAEFLDKHLEKAVRDALQSHGDLHQTQLKEDLRKAEQAAKDAGINPDQAPRALEIREKLKASGDLDTLAGEVYSHLYTFFSRYYQEGDFLGLHRSTIHGREKYMLPYNGEEVKLVWANMDQYYIKSSELLRDYAFQITPGEGTLLEGAVAGRFTVHFKLVEGDTEKDNRKSGGKATRAFALDDEKPLSEDDPATLTIRFRYCDHPAERNLQDKLNADTEKTLADNLPPKWKAVLFAPDPTYQGKDKKDARTVLQKHLRSYTAKYQFDYFIHKDLGGFLRRELDFYIKNEVMYLEDIEDLGAPKAEEYLSKIRALRCCAVPVIGMLEQLENFQKKLWLKKKFVVETRYCLTLDRVPESLYPEIAANAAQREEWVLLYAINEMKEDMAQPGYSEPLTVEFLKANTHMMLDTRHFGRDFMLRLLVSIANLDEMLDGVCFHSENFQALQLMQETYREQVRCVYIDPPYNTDASPIVYKNGYQRSSWICLLADRLRADMPLRLKPSLRCIAIDDFEYPDLMELLGSFSSEVHHATASVRSKPQGRPTATGFSANHEYAVFWGHADAKVGRLPRAGSKADRYPHSDEQGIYAWANFRKSGTDSDRADRRKSFYPVFVKAGSVRIPKMSWDEQNEDWKVLEEPQTDEVAVFPVDLEGREKVWTCSAERAVRELADIRVERSNGNRIEIVKKYRPNQEGALPGTWWDDSSYSASESGTKVLKDMFGAKDFDYPKSVHLVRDCLRIGNLLRDDIVLDYFAGSGTTGDSVVRLNREDNGRRRYLLVEMGEYFDSVLVPRLKKVAHSDEWKDGKPQNRSAGISHAFKCIRLEGYEDVLNNLRLKRTPQQEAALKAASEEARDSYMVGYFLDIESAGSASLLDLDQFRDPFGYKLKIGRSSAGETVETTIDLVETLNWLLGLKVKHIDAQKGFLTVTGERRAGGRTLVIWRTLSDEAIADNNALETFLGKIAVNPADTEFDYLYVNGSHTLADPHNKVHLIEEAFQRLMFDTPDFGMGA